MSSLSWPSWKKKAWCVSLLELAAKIQSRSWRELRLLPEALLLLGLMRLAVLFVPFQRTVRFLGLTPQTLPCSDANPQQAAAAAAIGWSVRAMAARTPWESACLAQALAGMVMLKRRGIPALLFLGVAKETSGPVDMAAHAWLSCAGTVVTGEGGYERFTVIGSFAGKDEP